jgi:hypothetical protein
MISPVEVLRGFMKAMNKWERESWKIYTESKIKNRDLVVQQQRFQESQERIFAKYCTPKKRLVAGRFGSFQNPPEYDPETENILNVDVVSKRRVIIYTQQGTGFRNKCRYVLLRKGNRWLIDNKKIFLGPYNKWIRATL